MRMPARRCLRAAATAAAAAAAATQPQVRRARLLVLLMLPAALSFLLYLCGVTAAAVVPVPHTQTDSGNRKEVEPTGIEADYTLGPRQRERRVTLVPQKQLTVPDPLLLTQTGQKRNAIYGDEFNSYLEELRSKWLVCHRQGISRATVRTQLKDLTGFAACAELNLELEDTWADNRPGSGQLGYRWVLWPREPLGSDVHMRTALAPLETRVQNHTRLFQQAIVLLEEAGMSVPFNILDATVSVEHLRQPTGEVTDPETFSWRATSQGTGSVLAVLKYQSIVVENNKLISFPEITLGEDGELCGIMLLRSLLKTAKSFGLTEVRLRVASANMPLLKAASVSGFRPVDVSAHEGKAFHTLVANPQLAEPPIADMKQKVAALERMVRLLDTSYFQALAMLCIQQELPDTPKISVPAAAERWPDPPKHSKARGHGGPMMGLGIDKVHRSAVLAGLGTALLVVIVALIWRRKKKGGPPAGRGAAHPRYQEEWYLNPPAHWPDTQGREDVYGDPPSEEPAEEWKGSAVLDR